MAKKKLLLLITISWFAKIAFAIDLNDLIAAQNKVTVQQNKEIIDYIGGAIQNSQTYNKDVQQLLSGVESNLECNTSCDASPVLMPAVKNNSKVVSNDEQLYVFGSLSMPINSLVAILKEAKQYGAVVILRGLKNNSYKQTALALQKIIKQAKIGLVIDPEKFKKYNIQTVPSIVLTRGPSFDRITGNISLQYALEEFSKRGDLSQYAKSLLSKKS